MKTKTLALALTALAAFSIATAQLAPAQAERAAAPRQNLELTIDEADIRALSIKSSGGSMAAGSGGGAGKASFSDLSVMMSSSKASPLLAKKVVRGNHFPTVKLTVRKAGKEQQDYYVITLESVTVVNYQHQSNTGGDRPMESLSLNFAKIEFDYKRQK